MAILEIWCPSAPHVSWSYNRANYSATGGRGNRPCTMLDGWNNTGGAYHTLANLYTTICAGYAVKVYTNHALITFLDTTQGSATQCYLAYVTLDGGYSYRLRLYNGSGAVIATGVKPMYPLGWYYIEFKATISNTTGSAIVRIDGVEDINVSNVDTQNITNPTVNCIYFQTTDLYPMHDYYITDGAGGPNDDGFLGDVRCEVAVPIADGIHYNAFTPSTGSEYSCIDELTLSTTDYVSSGLLNDISTYQLTTQTLGTSIYAVRWAYYASKTDADDRSLSTFLVSQNDTETIGPSKPLNLTNFANIVIYETDPADSQPWTDAKINGSEFGFKVVV